MIWVPYLLSLYLLMTTIKKVLVQLLRVSNTYANDVDFFGDSFLWYCHLFNYLI